MCTGQWPFTGAGEKFSAVLYTLLSPRLSLSHWETVNDTCPQLQSLSHRFSDFFIMFLLCFNETHFVLQYNPQKSLLGHTTITVMTICQEMPSCYRQAVAEIPFLTLLLPTPHSSLTTNSPRNGGDHIRDGQEPFQASMGHQEGKSLWAFGSGFVLGLFLSTAKQR